MVLPISCIHWSFEVSCQLLLIDINEGLLQIDNVGQHLEDAGIVVFDSAQIKLCGTVELIGIEH